MTDRLFVGAGLWNWLTMPFIGRSRSSDVKAQARVADRNEAAAERSATVAPGPASRFFEFHIGQDPGGLWRWTLMTVTGQPLARSARGYLHEHECAESMHRVLLVDSATPVVRV